jgi:threonine aldolase
VDEEKDAFRFVCAWNTEEEKVEELVEDIKTLNIKH